jgi:hypothetical protein
MSDDQLEKKGTIFKKSIQILDYVDDIDIVGQTVSSVQEAFLALTDATKTMGLEVNEEKTKLVQVTKDL